MEFLYSNFNPLKTGCSTFYDAFTKALKHADELDIAVGYISEESLAELQRLVELNNIRRISLTIGMHYIEGFTNPQYNAAMQLHKYLSDKNCGEVRLVMPFRFHGKLYLASKDSKPFAGIIGSSNLSSIVNDSNKIYDASVLFKDKQSVVSLQQFIRKLNVNATKPIDQCTITEFRKTNPVLDDQEGVKKATDAERLEVKTSLTDISFEIPIKTEPKSNLNAYFGKGRVGANGLIIPRHWYESELIVSSTITNQPGYPQAKTESAVFDVLTDDGYKFKCKVSGDYSKNFRSEGDLKILGRWLKGRMENKGALIPGEMVTEEVLSRYGRKSFTLTKTTIPGLWYLSFEVD